MSLSVLRTPASETPSQLGTLIYYSLREHCRIVLTADGDASDKLVDGHWLGVYGFNAHQLVSYPAHYEEIKPSRLHQIRRLQSSGFGGDLIAVETNPAIVEELLYNGIPSMLVIEPQYFSPRHRPDFAGEKKSWDSMVDEVERQNIMKANDTRVSPDVM